MSLLRDDSVLSFPLVKCCSFMCQWFDGCLLQQLCDTDELSVAHLQRLSLTIHWPLPSHKLDVQ